MPEYCFKIADGSAAPQPGPIELPDLEVAKSEAILLAGQMLKDADGKFWNDSHWQIEITTREGLVLATVNVDGFNAPAGEQASRA